MDRRKFLNRLSIITAGSLVLAVGLRLGFGKSWFSFYGCATVALTTVPFLTVLLWQRLPERGRSRWWSVLVPSLCSPQALYRSSSGTFFSAKAVLIRRGVSRGKCCGPFLMWPCLMLWPRWQLQHYR